MKWLAGPVRFTLPFLCHLRVLLKLVRGPVMRKAQDVPQATGTSNVASGKSYIQSS